MDEKNNVDVNMEPLNKNNLAMNLALNHQKNKRAMKVQALYDQVKEHAKKFSRGKSVHLLVKKRCLNEDEIDNILMLDAENWDIQKLENVVIQQRRNKNAISLNLSNQFTNKIRNPFDD